MVFVAYIDPGLGLLAWQALVAACLGTVFYLKKTRTWLVGVVMRPFRRKKAPEAPVIKPPAPGNDMQP